MKIKKYTGISLESIFAKVKSDLGEKAVILNTKKSTDKKMLGLPKIEVTAALAPPVFEEAVLPKPTIDEAAVSKFLQALREKIGEQSATKSNPIAREPERQSDSNPINISSEIIEIKELLKSFCLNSKNVLDKRLNSIKKLLITSQIEDDVVLSLLEKLSHKLPHDTEKHIDKKTIENTLSDFLFTSPFQLNKTDNEVIILLGTTGVGKTTTLAKLASIINLNHNRKVAFLTLDSFRIGAHEHLAQYARILDAPFRAVSKNENLKEIVEEFRQTHTVFIDSSGFSQYNKLKIRELFAVIKDIEEAKKLLLFSASTHPAEIKKILHHFCSVIDIQGLIVTKLDEVEKPGQLLSIKPFTKTPITYITDGQVVPDNIKPAKSLNIVRKILYGKFS